MQGIYQMMNQIMFVYGPFQDAVVGVGRAFEVLDQVSDIREDPNAIAKPSFEHSVRFRDVSMEYEPGRPVLRGVDFEVAKGEKIAIVGETGSGKTTILNLMPRLYDITGGAIEVDGIDLRQLRITSLRDLVSMVPQEPLLFSTTVRDEVCDGFVVGGGVASILCSCMCSAWEKSGTGASPSRSTWPRARTTASRFSRSL